MPSQNVSTGKFTLVIKKIYCFRVRARVRVDDLEFRCSIQHRKFSNNLTSTSYFFSGDQALEKDSIFTLSENQY